MKKLPCIDGCGKKQPRGLNDEEKAFLESRKQAWKPWVEEPVLKFSSCAFELHKKIRPKKRFEDIPDFFRLRGHVELYFHSLATCALDCPEAARRLHFIVTMAVRELNRAAQTNPKFFQPLGEVEFQWPGFLSNHPEIEVLQKEGIFSKVRIGQRSSIRTKGKKFSFGTTETRIAVQLWRTMDLIRRGETDLGIRRLCVPKVIEARAKHLQPLTRKNHFRWWKACEPLFIFIYGKDFENHKDFAEWLKNQAYKENQSDHKASPKARSFIRRDIKNKIKQAFKSIAPHTLSV